MASRPGRFASPAVLATIPVGTLPAGVDANPVTTTAYVANFDDNAVSVHPGRHTWTRTSASSPTPATE